MSISERERQTLDSIESDLAISAPRLASMLGIFSRLTAGEQMPAREPLRRFSDGPGGLGVTARRAGPHRVRRLRVGRKTRGWLLLAVAAALLGLMIGLTHGVRVTPCTHSFAIACRQGVAVPRANVQYGGRR